MFEEFKYSFLDASELILVDIYSSAREEIDNSVSSKLLKNEISKIFSNVLHISDLTDVVKYVDQKAYGNDWIVLTMGAGNIYKIADNLN